VDAVIATPACKFVSERPARRVKRVSGVSQVQARRAGFMVSDELRTPNVPSPQDWVLVLERVNQ
jgi:hypothetical protein